jgi:hypothetical protein
VMLIGSNPYIEVYKDGERSALWWLRTSAAPADGRRDERENTARGLRASPTEEKKRWQSRPLRRTGKGWSPPALPSTSKPTVNESR